MKIKLEKQNVTSLSTSELNKIFGGGEARSDRRHGHCRYSAKHGVNKDQCGDVTGCTTATYATSTNIGNI